MSFIVPMEKPKRCGLCPCFHAEHPMHCQAVKAHKDKRIIAPYGAPIPDWCPLIELPPHGDLVDLSDMVRPNDSMRLMTIDEQLRRTCEGWSADRKQYVVIEAEGSETDA